MDICMEEEMYMQMEIFIIQDLLLFKWISGFVLAVIWRLAMEDF